MEGEEERDRKAGLQACTEQLHSPEMWKAVLLFLLVVAVVGDDEEGDGKQRKSGCC